MLPAVLQLHLSRIVCYGRVGAAAIFLPLGRQGLPEGIKAARQACSWHVDSFHPDLLVLSA
jgi:hypothetical protein